MCGVEKLAQNLTPPFVFWKTGISRSIILKLMIDKQGWKLWIGFI